MKIIFIGTGDIQRRLCTAAEISFYFSNTITSGSNYLKANRNCNLTSWVPGCEPGWACSTDPDQNPDLRDSREIPARTVACQPCCEGFFCPHGLTCMIRKYIINLVNISSSTICWDRTRMQFILLLLQGLVLVLRSSINYQIVI